MKRHAILYLFFFVLGMLMLRLLIVSVEVKPTARPANARETAGRIEGTVQRIVDGDTVRLNNLPIRLAGIDAPELEQRCNGGRTPCGWLSADHLRQAAEGREAVCTVQSRDRYGRLIAVCLVGDLDLSAYQALSGWALAYRQYSKEYVLEEDTARQAKSGMWAGEFTMPWEWRHTR